MMPGTTSSIAPIMYAKPKMMPVSSIGKIKDPPENSMPTDACSPRAMARLIFRMPGITKSKTPSVSKPPMPDTIAPTVSPIAEPAKTMPYGMLITTSMTTSERTRGAQFALNASHACERTSPISQSWGAPVAGIIGEGGGGAACGAAYGL
ncbi:MAG: hypothetical protein U0235_14640 [Polyangiaceae bacterium]